MKLCYLVLDRPDLQFPSKELALWMQAPTVENLEVLKSVARFFIGTGQLVQEFVRLEHFADMLQHFMASAHHFSSKLDCNNTAEVTSLILRTALSTTPFVSERRDVDVQ